MCVLTLVSAGGCLCLTLFRQGHSFSLDFASVSIQPEYAEGVVERIDVPMRAFADGYYRNLIRMYKYLRVRYHPQQFLYSFEKYAVNPTSSKSTNECYFIYSSNNHRLLPIRPEGMGLLSWFIEIMYVAGCYLWWSVCCFWIPPLLATNSHACESLDEYIQRIMLPPHFVNFYLLPLFSSVATCSHTELLQFPARDLTEYKRQSAGGEHYTATGLHRVQEKLASGLEARFSATVTKVEALSNGKLKVMWNNVDDSSTEETFDQVVLAVAPDIAGKIYQPIRKTTTQIPTTMVCSVVQVDGSKASVHAPAAIELASSSSKTLQTIHFSTSISLAKTESIHVHDFGAKVITYPISDNPPGPHVLRSVKFFRALRTSRSRHVINEIFCENPRDLCSKERSWKNGDKNVWLVGGWCWDGMVLLEGCIVSAMRVASALDVNIPWR